MGSTTLSITWITPFEAMTSVLMTRALSTITLPPSVRTVSDWPCTVFTAPGFTGGVPVTRYTVTANPGGATTTGTGSPITVGGLASGIAYTFTVTAQGSAGSSTPSAASNAVTPMANQSIKALVDPRDIAALAVFLASDSAKSISGQALPIDGDIQRLS